MFRRKSVIRTRSCTGRKVTYEVFKAIGREVHVSHGRKYPDKRIAGCLLETSQSTRLTLVLNSIQFHTVISQLALIGCQPLCREWEVWQEEKPDKGTIRSVALVHEFVHGPSAWTRASEKM